MRNYDSKNAFDNRSISYTLEEKLRYELEHDENVVLMDSPVPNFFAAMNLVVFGAALAFTAFAVCMWHDFPRDRDTSLGLLHIALPTVGMAAFSVVAVSMWILVALNMMVDKTVLYAITDRRVLTMRKVFFSISVVTRSARELGTIVRTEKRNGLGNVSFNNFAVGEEHYVLTFPGFTNIRNPREVERILKNMISENAK